MKLLGGYFRTLREYCGWTQAYVAKAVLITEKQVHNWGRGRNIPKSPELAFILDLLGGNFNDISTPGLCRHNNV